MHRLFLLAVAAVPFWVSVALAAPPIETPVPEPATLGLLAVGAGVVMLARWRRR